VGAVADVVAEDLEVVAFSLALAELLRAGLLFPEDLTLETFDDFFGEVFFEGMAREGFLVAGDFLGRAEAVETSFSAKESWGPKLTSSSREGAMDNDASKNEDTRRAPVLSRDQVFGVLRGITAAFRCRQVQQNKEQKGNAILLKMRKNRKWISLGGAISRAPKITALRNSANI